MLDETFKTKNIKTKQNSIFQGICCSRLTQISINRNKTLRERGPGPWLWGWCGRPDRWASCPPPGSWRLTFFFDSSLCDPSAERERETLFMRWETYHHFQTLLKLNQNKVCACLSPPNCRTLLGPVS